ncbi:MAG: S41 family peptidase [Eubacteriales bacterium]|nr:S41 family peptidase [Eubacteriales bacterium]
MKSDISTEKLLKKYKRRSRWFLALLIIFVAGAGVFFYMNYNFLAFKYFIAEHYIYTDSLKELYKQEINRDTDKYYKYFDEMAISVITKAIREMNNDRYTYLYIPEAYQSHKQEEIVEAAQSHVKELNASTAYLSLTNFSVYTADFVNDSLDFLDNYSNLIIDLRDDSGGDIDAMVEISSRFLPKKSIVAVDKMRFMDWTYKTKGGKKLEYDKIVILQNGNTASASENLAAALRENLDNVTIIGEKSFGKGIGQYTLELKGGYAVKATILEWYTPDGNNIQGNGIDPDIYYNGEDPIGYALDWMSK